MPNSTAVDAGTADHRRATSIERRIATNVAAALPYAAVSATATWNSQNCGRPPCPSVHCSRNAPATTTAAKACAVSVVAWSLAGRSKCQAARALRPSSTRQLVHATRETAPTRAFACLFSCVRTSCSRVTSYADRSETPTHRDPRSSRDAPPHWLPCCSILGLQHEREAHGPDVYEETFSVVSSVCPVAIPRSSRTRRQGCRGSHRADLHATPRLVITIRSRHLRRVCDARPSPRRWWPCGDLEPLADRVILPQVSHLGVANTQSMSTIVGDPRPSARRPGSMVFRSPAIAITRCSGSRYCAATRRTSSAVVVSMTRAYVE